MNKNTHRAAAAVLVAATVAGGVPPALAQAARPTIAPTIAIAGSAIVVPATYTNGILRGWNQTAGTITIDDVTYPVHSSKVPDNLSIGEAVIVTILVEHYGPAARKVVMGVERAEAEINQ